MAFIIGWFGYVSRYNTGNNGERKKDNFKVFSKTFFLRQKMIKVLDMRWFTILMKTIFTLVQVQVRSYGKLGSEEDSIN